MRKKTVAESLNKRKISIRKTKSVAELEFDAENSLVELFKDILPANIYKIFLKHKIFHLIKDKSPMAWKQLIESNKKVLLKEGVLKKSTKCCSGYKWDKL